MVEKVEKIGIKLNVTPKNFRWDSDFRWDSIFLYFSWVSTSNARYRLRREIRVPQGPLGPDVSRNPNCGLQCGKTGPPAQISPAKNWTNSKKF